MEHIAAALIAPVPIFHLWLHALLSFWRKRPLLFYLWAVFRPESVSRERIAKGIFERFPHPAYLGHIFIMLGLFLATAKFYVAFVVAFQLVVMPIVIWLEEEELKKRVASP